jgi:hypothetical protein
VRPCRVEDPGRTPVRYTNTIAPAYQFKALWPASCQGFDATGLTWGGLRFGTPETSIGPISKTIKIGVAAGTVELTFDDQHLLKRVWLNFSRRTPMTAAEAVDEISRRMLTYKYVAKGLLERYGAPDRPLPHRR